MGKFRDPPFVLQESTNPQNEQIGVEHFRTALCRKVEIRITASFPAFLLEI